MSRAPLSMCLIFRDDPLLEQAVASVRMHVAEICIVVDDDAPEESVERMVRLVETKEAHHARIIWDRAAWCDDFAHTRNLSFEMATQPYVGWMDTDDIITGAFNLERECKRIPPGGRLMAPYDYETDKETGEVVRQQWRERIVASDGTWHWEHPTHESLVKKNGHRHDPGLDVWANDIRWVHQRTETGTRARSLKILERWYAAGHMDEWTNLNLGLELMAAGRHDEAVDHMKLHFEESGWKEERAMSALRVAECYLAGDMMNKGGGYEAAERWIGESLLVLPGNFEAHYLLARLELMRAELHGDPDAARRCVAACKRAVAAPENRSPIGRNPVDRSFNVWETMRAQAEILQDWDTAMLATEEALKARPDYPPMLLSRKRYKAAKLVASFSPKEDVDGDGLERQERQESGRGVAANAQGAAAADQVAGERAARNAAQDEGQPRGGVPAARGEQVPAQGHQAHGEGAHRGQSLIIEVEEGATVNLTEPGEYRVRISHKPRSEAGPLDVVFLCGPAADPWTPDIVAKKGHGGSETAVIELAKRLHSKGHRVRVYNNPGLEGEHGGVDYLRWDPELHPECDVAVVWRMAQLLPQANAKVRVMWCHDTEAMGMSYGLSLLADRFLALSEWHKDNLIKKHQIPESQVYVTRNGIDVSLLSGSWARRNPKRAIYASSPDRGLGALLDMWPQIWERTGKEASLDVYYSFTNWQRQADAFKNEQHRFLVSTLQRRLKSLAPMGVRYHGFVSQMTLVDSMMTAGAWLYPTWFQETSCQVAMWARACGLSIITSPIAALKETVGQWGTMVDGDWVSDDYQERFIEAAVGALLDDDPEVTRLTRQRVAQETLGWDGVADDWDRLFRELVKDSSRGVMPEYREFEPESEQTA